jgi:small subunit ribosomal protein S2
MRELLEAGIHFGHQTRRWHPKMARYIYGQRNGVYIIDLQKTLRQVYKAYQVVRDTVAEGGIVLFVGTKRQAQEAVQRESQRCGMYSVTNRWLGGTLTNFKTVRGSIAELKNLQDMDATGRIDRYGKKEAIQMRKRRAKLEKNLSGIQDMPGLPDVMFVIDTKREDIAVHEAARLGIPCIGIVDTNCDPDEVSIPVPGNDDAIRAVSLFCKLMADAAMDGRMRGEKLRADGVQGRLVRRRQEEVGIDKVEDESEADAPEEDAEVEAESEVEAEVEAEPETL